MSLRFEMRGNGDVVVHQVDELAKRIENVRPVLEDFGEHMENSSIPETFRQEGRPKRWKRGPWSSRRQQQESTRLIQSVKHEVSGDRLRVGTNLRYAAQRHFGGELKPKKAKALAIPLPGVARSMRRPRRWGDRLFFMKSVKGKADTVGILATTDRRGEVVPRFVLRRKVTQPARPFIVAVDEDMVYLSRRLVEYATTGELL